MIEEKMGTSRLENEIENIIGELADLALRGCEFG